MKRPGVAKVEKLYLKALPILVSGGSGGESDWSFPKSPWDGADLVVCRHHS